MNRSLTAVHPNPLRSASFKAYREVPESPPGLCNTSRSQNNFTGFKTGSVLVARTTNPAWTPLFFRAGEGDVTESGGPLARCGHRPRDRHPGRHGDLPNVLYSVPEGATVTVNGTEGHVKPIDLCCAVTVLTVRRDPLTGETWECTLCHGQGVYVTGPADPTRNAPYYPTRRLWHPVAQLQQPYRHGRRGCGRERHRWHRRAGAATFDAMKLIADFVLHLDHDHDCDCDGWERVERALSR